MPRLSLPALGMAPDDDDAIPLLYRLEAENPGVTILTPHYSDEPWRAEIREGKVPGESRCTSGFLVARYPGELLRKLEKMFAGDDPEDSG